MLSKLTLFVTASFALLAIANPFPKLTAQASPSTGLSGVGDAVPYSSYTGGLPFSSPRVGGLTKSWTPSPPTAAVNDGALGSSATIASAIPTPSAVDGSTICDVGSMTMCCDSLDDMSIGWGCSPLDATMKCANTTACCYLPEEPSETEPTALICYSDDIVVNK